MRFAECNPQMSNTASECDFAARAIWWPVFGSRWTRERKGEGVFPSPSRRLARIKCHVMHQWPARLQTGSRRDCLRRAFQGLGLCLIKSRQPTLHMRRSRLSDVPRITRGRRPRVHWRLAAQARMAVQRRLSNLWLSIKILGQGILRRLCTIQVSFTQKDKVGAHQGGPCRQ